MKAKIENGKIVIPRELVKALHFPENGECEVVPQPPGFAVQPPAPSPGETRAPGGYPPPPELVRFLQAPPVVLSIDEIVAAGDEPDAD